MIELTQAELINEVFQELGDPMEVSVPRGLVFTQVERALGGMTQLAVKVKPDALRVTLWEVLAATQEVVDLPASLQAIEHLSLVSGTGDEATEVELHKVGPGSAIAAEIVGPTYGWHYVDARRIRVLRPDADEWAPGVRFIGVGRFALSTQPDRMMVLPEGAIAFIRATAAIALRTAPGANVGDLAVLRQALTDAREELISAYTFMDAATGVPIAEAASRY